MKIKLEDVRTEIARRKYAGHSKLFPSTGPLRRQLYVKHREFFTAGASHRVRSFQAANRSGKSIAGGYEDVCHATGLYPDWWDGKVFKCPTEGTVAGETGKLTRDSIQLKLFGPPEDIGSGLIPKDRIVNIRPKSGIPNAIDTAFVKNEWGGVSSISFQSYDQGRKAFQAYERQWIHLDEEPPLDIFTECLIRTMTTQGVVYLTYTPLLGLSETVTHIANEVEAGRAHMTTATWDDAPHLTTKDKAELLAAFPPHMRDARSKGIPALGAGAIYPVAESDFVVDPFPIPKHWKWCYGFDVGWNNTATAWLVHDLDNDIVYVVRDYKRGNVEPSVHASAIRQVGEIPGAIDPAARGRSQIDGEQLLQKYTDLGLDIMPADNTVETGIYEIWERLGQGRLKVFKTCSAWLSEFRVYRRDEKGRIVKQNDHLMDATRYGVMSGLSRAALLVKPAPKEETSYPQGDHAWMGT